MPFSYSARLRRDLRDWQERGLIQPEQAERIIAHAFAPRGLRHLQTVLALCILLLVAPSIIAFVAANWSAMRPLARLIVLVLANTAAVGATYAAALRHARERARTSRSLVDGLATVSLVVAAATLALIGQTFHVASDPEGFAATVAILGLATALVTRSGGAAAIAGIALIAIDLRLGDFDFGPTTATAEAVPASGIWFWTVGPALFLASLSGWLAARETTLLLLLIVFTNHLGSAPAPLTVMLPADRILTVGALALVVGSVLSRFSLRGRWEARLHDGAQALTRAALSLSLIGILMTSAQILGFFGARPPLAAASAFAAMALAAFTVTRARSPQRTGDLLVLAAAALALLVWLLAGTGQKPSTFATVWGGIVPALMLTAAGDLCGRRELYRWGIALTGGLTVAMLVTSGNLIAFSGNLLLCACLVAVALAACLWAARHLDGRAA